MNPFRVLDQLEQVIAREYLRVSQDRSGRSRSTVEQHGDHEGDCEEHSWRLGTPYEDSSVSASRYSRKRRDGFHELIDDLEYDRFGAQVLMLWENSRG
jgi:site-specific DNA recombinase